MTLEPTSNYPTLRRTRTTLRVFAPLLSAVFCLVGMSLFVAHMPNLSNERFALSERLIFGVIGLSYLLGFPLVGVVLHFVLRAGADLIDVWIDSAVAADKTADLVEQQLVPGVHRLCQILERQESAAGASPARPVPAVVVESRPRAGGSARR